MSDDCYEARIRFYANIPRVTHKVVCNGVTIGRVYDNGHIEIDDPVTAHQVQRSSSDEAPT